MVLNLNIGIMSNRNKKLNGWHKKTVLNFQIGLVVAFSVVYFAFEWKKEYSESKLALLAPQTIVEEDTKVIKEIIPNDPPAPKVLQPTIKEVDRDPVDPPVVDLTVDDDKPVVKNPVFQGFGTGDPDVVPVVTKKETAEEIFTFVEEKAAFTGGEEAFRKFIGKNLNYPKAAKKAGIQGVVHVLFVIEKDGSLSDISIVKGIGGGCDEEAMRVLKMSPAWKPAKQRGKEVRSKLVLPIKFQLN